MMPQFELAIDANVEKLRQQIKMLKAKMEYAATTPSGIYSAQSMQYCCAVELENLGTSFVSLRQAFPVLTTRYRSLNLPLDGQQRFSDLAAKLDSARAPFAATKSAASLEAAAAALRDFSLRVDEMAQSAHAAESK